MTGGSTGRGGSTFSCATPPSFTTTDPLFPLQWYIRNTGQSAYSVFAGHANEDIHLCGPGTPRGAGVTVAVVDSGAEASHEDLTNIDITGGGTTSHNFFTGTSDPTTAETVVDGDHGTSVSGIITAPDNGKGINGIAAAAKLVVYNFLGFGVVQDGPTEASSLGGDTYSEGAWLFNQSWGVPVADAITLADVNADSEGNYQEGVNNLRTSKGAIYVKAAGNGFFQNYAYFFPRYYQCPNAQLTCQNANMDPYNALPYQIVVGATNAKGAKSSYSTTGSALWVSAPGGEFGLNYVDEHYPRSVYPNYAYEPAIVTTDQAGCIAGYSWSDAAANLFDDGAVPENINCNYTSTFNGTSSATPVTSGVVALMLGVNPALTWRDVKHILAATSEQVDAGFTEIRVLLGNGYYVAEPAWITNGADYHFHNWYGFGRVHAHAALAMANPATWTPNGFGGSTSHDAFVDSGYLPAVVTSAEIPDNSTVGATGSVNLDAAAIGVDFIEAVQIQVDITHAFPGDVGIELTSPSGTRSVLLNIRNAFGRSDLNIVDWAPLSNAFYGENPDGTWTLKVVDGMPEDAGVLNSWSIRIFGHAE
ncbi:MAG TPA: S8 family peptidase [bacterium]